MNERTKAMNLLRDFLTGSDAPACTSVELYPGPGDSAWLARCLGPDGPAWYLLDPAAGKAERVTLTDEQRSALGLPD